MVDEGEDSTAFEKRVWDGAPTGTLLLLMLQLQQERPYWDRWRRGLYYEITMPLRDKFGSTTTVVPGREAGELIQLLHAVTICRAERVTAQLSGAEWLWFIRRIVPIFEFNDIPSTAPYCRALAEALTVRSTATPPRVPSGAVWCPDISKAVLHRVWELVEVTYALYSLQATARWAAKDSPVEFRTDDLPEARPDDALGAAVKSFDDRDARGGNPLARAALYDHGLPADYGALGAGWLMIVGDLPVESDIELPLEDHGFTHARGRYMFRPFDLSRVGILTDDRLPLALRFRPGFVELVALLTAGVMGALMRQGGLPTLVSTGYRLVQRDHLVEDLEFALEWLRVGQLEGILPRELIPASPAVVLERCDALEPGLNSPHSGTPLRWLAGGPVVLDLLGASREVFRVLSRADAVEGDAANVWSSHFELHLQRMVDASAWKPTAEIGALRGRTLCLGGDSLTDIDALGEEDGTMLLVSAKGRAFTDSLDQGTHADVRNARDAALTAHEQLASVIARLRETPIGDNYDLSAFHTIVGVVAYPFLPFVPTGPATADVLPGLPAVVSAAELEEFCQM